MENNLATVLVPQSTLSVSRHIAPATFAEYEEVKDEQFERPVFLDGPSSAIELADLKSKCVVPCWPTGEPCISHPQLIEQVRAAASTVFGNEYLEQPEIRVSHQQIGRVASALNKKASELTDSERTLWYQRIAFCIVVSATDVINGKETRLVVGGVRAMNNENIRTRRGVEKFKLFIASRVTVCTNLCIFGDGTIDKLEVTEASEIYDHALTLFQGFNPDLNRNRLELLNQTSMTADDFSHIIGKLRVYEALSPARRNELQLPQVILGDQCLNAATRDFVNNPNFGIGNSDTLTSWQFLNLLNASVKNSYIDRFLEKQVNAMDLTLGITNAINGIDDKNYEWFLK